MKFLGLTIHRGNCPQGNESNTPDVILAQFLLGCLAAFTVATQQRETWYGRDASPTMGALTGGEGRG